MYTILFIDYKDIPSESLKYITYGIIMVDYRPQEEEANRTRLSIGGNILYHPGGMSTPNADTTTSSTVCNSVSSTSDGTEEYFVEATSVRCYQILLQIHPWC